MFAHAVEVDRIGGLLIQAFCALYTEIAAVKTRKRGIKRQRDGFAARAFDDGGHDVALGKNGLFQSLVLRLVTEDIIVHTGRFRGGGGKRQKAVAAVDVEHLCDRAELVRRIVFTVAREVFV